MLSDVTDELLGLAGQVMGWSAGMALLGLLAGSVGGFYLWRLMRDEKWLEGRWNWSRRVKWPWAVLLAGVLGMGGCSMGMVWGAGTGAKRWVRDGDFFHKTLGHSYAALMFFRAEARLGGGKADALLVKDVAALVKASSGLRGKVAELEKNLGRQLDMWLDRQEISGTQRLVLKRVAQFLWDQHVQNPLDDVEAEAVLREVSPGGGNEESRRTARKVIDKAASAFKTAATETVSGTMWPVLWFLAPVTWALAFGPLCVFWLAWWWGNRGQPRGTPVPPRL